MGYRVFNYFWLILFLSNSVAHAQSPNGILNLFGGLIQSAMTQAALAEWRKLPQNEIACIDRALQQRGDSLRSAIQQGIMPSDARVADVRLTCRNQFAPQPSQAMRTDVQTSKYSVDGLALGAQVRFDSAVYRDYKCAPSDQFADFTWCQKKRVESEARGQFTSSYSILHSAAGTALYVSRSLEPAFFTGNEANEEIDRLSKKHGAAPQIVPMPQRSGVPYGMIAIWGNVVLKPLDTSSVDQLAAGRDVRRGFLIDHIGNLQRSAQLGLPIYRLGGGAGYVWAASYDQNGRGILRFLTIDASAISSSIQIAHPSNSARLLWNHNGSTVYLEAQGHSRKFFYQQPRPGMQSAGAKSGSLLFEGETDGQQYQGTAYIFNSRCGPLPYLVSGPIFDSDRRVELLGRAPRVDNDCHIVEYADDVLTFQLIEPTAPTSTGEAKATDTPPQSTEPVTRTPDLEAENRLANERATKKKLAELEETKLCEQLKGSKAYFVAVCIVRGMAQSRQLEGLQDARGQVERAQAGLDCTPDALSNLQKLSDRSAAAILNSGVISKLMDFADAMTLECKNAANVNFEEK